MHSGMVLGPSYEGVSLRRSISEWTWAVYNTGDAWLTIGGNTWVETPVRFTIRGEEFAAARGPWTQSEIAFYR